MSAPPTKREIRDAFRTLLLPTANDPWALAASIFRRQLRRVCGADRAALCRAYAQGNIEAYEAGRRAVYFKLYEIAGATDSQLDALILGEELPEASGEEQPLLEELDLE